MYKLFKKKTLTEVTPYTPEFDMSLVSVSEADKLTGSPKEGDMIARNPNNPDDLRLIEANTFAETYEPAVIVDSEGFLDKITDKIKSLFKKKEEVAKESPSIDCESTLTETTVKGLSGDAMGIWIDMYNAIIDDCENNTDITKQISKFEALIEKVDELFEKGTKKVTSRKLNQSEVDSELFDPKWGISKELDFLNDSFTRNQSAIEYINDSIWIDDNEKEKIEAASITKLKELNKTLYDKLKKVVSTLDKEIKVNDKAIDSENIDAEFMGTLAVPIVLVGGAFLLGSTVAYFANKASEKAERELLEKLKGYSIRTTPAAINLLSNFAEDFANFIYDEGYKDPRPDQLDYASWFIDEVLNRAKANPVSLPVFLANSDSDSKWFWKNDNDKVKVYATETDIYDGINKETLVPLAKHLLLNKKPSELLDGVDDALNYLIAKYNRNEFTSIVGSLIKDPTNIGGVLNTALEGVEMSSIKEKMVASLLKFKKSVEKLSRYIDTNIRLVKNESVDKEEYQVGVLTVYEIGEDVTSRDVDRAVIRECLEEAILVELDLDQKTKLINELTPIHATVYDYVAANPEISKLEFKKYVISVVHPALDNVFSSYNLSTVSMMVDTNNDKLSIIDWNENVYDLVLAINYDNKTFSVYKPSENILTILNSKVKTIEADNTPDATVEVENTTSPSSTIVDAESYKTGGITVYELGDDNNGVNKSFSADLKTAKSIVDGLDVIELSPELLEKTRRDLNRGNLKASYKKEIEGVISKSNEDDAASITDTMDKYFDREPSSKKVLFETLALWYVNSNELKASIVGLTVTEINKILKSSKLSPITTVIEDAANSDAYFILVGKDGIYNLIFDRTHDNDSFSVYVPSWNIIEHLNEFVLDAK